MVILAKSNKRLVNKRYLSKVIGYLQSTALAIPSARYHLVTLYADLNSVNGWNNTTNVRLQKKSLDELTYFWANIKNKDIGRSWFPPEKSGILVTRILLTDASKFQWGSHLHILPVKEVSIHSMAYDRELKNF